jgi:hypothetical protein
MESRHGQRSKWSLSKCYPDSDSDRKCSSISDTVVSTCDYPVIDSDYYDR